MNSKAERWPSPILPTGLHPYEILIRFFAHLWWKWENLWSRMAKASGSFFSSSLHSVSEFRYAVHLSSWEKEIGWRLEKKNLIWEENVSNIKLLSLPQWKGNHQLTYLPLQPGKPDTGFKIKVVGTDWQEIIWIWATDLIPCVKTCSEDVTLKAEQGEEPRWCLTCIEDTLSLSSVCCPLKAL